MKKIFQTFLIVFLIVPIAMGFSACGKKDPTDQPFIKSQSSNLSGTTVSYNLTIVNPTDKTFTVTISVHTKYSTTLLNADKTASDWQVTSTTFEIAPKETINKTASATFPHDTSHWEHYVSISSYEKMDTQWLVGRWKNANTNFDDEWVFTATNYEYFGYNEATYGASGTWAIVDRNTTIRFIHGGITTDRPFSVENDNNTLHFGGETYNRVTSS